MSNSTGPETPFASRSACEAGTRRSWRPVTMKIGQAIFAAASFIDSVAAFFSASASPAQWLLTRDTSREKRLRVGVQLLLGRIQARRHDQYRRASRRARRPSQHSVERLALERYRDALARRAHQRKRRLVAVERAQVRVAHLLLIVHENELGEVVVHRSAHQVLAGSELVALRERLAPERLVHLAALAPGPAPVLPALDPGGHLLEIGEQHAVRDKARRPVSDRGGDARVG